MKIRAPGIQRTGQPRCEQFTAKATKSLSPVRRSQAALLAVMPAQGSGDASIRLTLVVSPTLKSASLPTARQAMGTFWKSGPRVNPTIGTPRAAHPAPSPTLTRARKRRLSGETGSALSGPLPGSLSGTFGGSSLSCVMRDISDPVQEGSGQQRQPHEAHDEGADEA